MTSSELFRAWPKTARLFRDVTISEKIDGTNACVIIQKHHFGESVRWEDEGRPENVISLVLGPDDETGIPEHEYWVYAQSRKRLINPASDNAGFAKWVQLNAVKLVAILGPGYHYGEWWGSGINRGYDNHPKTFSLFNTDRWGWLEDSSPLSTLTCVPELYKGPNDTAVIRNVLTLLADHGSWAAPGYDRPEGICVYHHASDTITKVTYDNDGPKDLLTGPSPMTWWDRQKTFVLRMLGRA